MPSEPSRRAPVGGAVPESFARGEERYRAAAYGESAEIFARLCEASPDDADAIRMLGLCRLRLGDPAGALNLLDRARGLAPDNPYAQLHYGLGLHAMGRNAEAAAQFRTCTRLLPDDPAPFLNLAAALIALGDDKRGALDAAKRARRRAPRMAAAEFRAVATRYGRTARNFLAGIHLVASVVLLN
jgi:predicted Zn-dependent protease